MRQNQSPREERFYDGESSFRLPGEGRDVFQRDRDRILYSNAFRRLAGVTQVVSPVEGDVVHNRLTHTLKVAQLARRIAELLLANTDKSVIEAAGGLHPEVCEAAALAHDIGLPPFAHIGEVELNRLVQERKKEGFEGNAQSFRIVNSLATRSNDHIGLNLTRATLQAMLKYPWQQDKKRSERKWGAYEEEGRHFRWVRKDISHRHRSLEAEVMDFADDLTYAVHDVDDFFRARLIPLHVLVRDRTEQERFLDRAKERWVKGYPDRVQEWALYEKAFEQLLNLLPIRTQYSGTRQEQAILREVGSRVITRYLDCLKVDGTGFPRLVLDPDKRREIDILKELNWAYVIQSRALRTQQFGQRRIIRELFEIYSGSDASNLVPSWILAELREEAEPYRLAADVICSLSDRQAAQMHFRLTGRSPGSIHDWF